VQLSVCVRDAVDGAVLRAQDPDRVLPAASVGKLLLLLEVARRLARGDLAPGEGLTRTERDAVADSGLWQHLRTPALPVEDLAVLVGAVSDNLATNVLLRAVGTGAVDAAGRDAGLRVTRLLDRVRDVRTPADPPHLSEGSAAELSGLMQRLTRGEAAGPVADAAVLRWLAAGADLSMVAASWGLDPLSRTAGDRGLRLWHKTGTDDGVRADVGVLRGPLRTVAYAGLACWDPSGPDRRDEALAALADLGRDLADMVGLPALGRGPGPAPSSTKVPGPAQER